MKAVKFMTPEAFKKCSKCKFVVDLFGTGELFCRGFDVSNASWFVSGMKNSKNDCKDFKEK